jgi:hypothetical protein
MYLIQLSIYLSNYLSICLSIYLSTYLSIYLSIYLPIYLSIYGSTALLWTLTVFQHLNPIQSAGLLGRGISTSQGRYLRTEHHKHTINAHNTGIHASSGIRTQDPSV